MTVSRRFVGCTLHVESEEGGRECLMRDIEPY